MNNLLGLYIIRKDVDRLRRDISQILNGYKRNGVCTEIEANIKYCETTVQLLDEYMEPGMYGVERCKQLLKHYIDSNDIDQLRKGKQVSTEILLELSVSLYNVIPLKDFPSCKPILDCTKDVAMECVKDLANNRFAKMGLGLVSLLSKGRDTVTVKDVLHFYNTIITELEREMYEEKWKLSPVELELYYKAKAERGYCYKAMLKTGIGIAHEFDGIIDLTMAEDDIRLFENRNNVRSMGYQFNNTSYCGYENKNE